MAREINPDSSAQPCGRRRRADSNRCFSRQYDVHVRTPDSRARVANGAKTAAWLVLLGPLTVVAWLVDRLGSRGGNRG